MKQLVAILILAIFILGFIPASIAKEKEDENKGAGVVTMRVVADKENKGNAYGLQKERKIENIEDIKMNFNNAKLKFARHKQNYIDSRDRLFTLRNSIVNCRGISEEKCKEIQQKLVDVSKEYLVAVANSMIDQLEKVKAKVEASEELSDEKVKEIVDDINEKIDELEDIINRINKATTKEEIVELAKELREEHRSTVLKLKFHTDEVVYGKIGRIIVRAEQLETKLDRILEKSNSTDLQDLVKEFKKHIEEARSDYDDAIELFAEAKETRKTDVKEAHKLLREAQGLMKQAHQHLKEAQKILQKIVHKIRGIEEPEETTTTTSTTTTSSTTSTTSTTLSTTTTIPSTTTTTSSTTTTLPTTTTTTLNTTTTT